MYRSSAREADLVRENRALRARLVKARLALLRGVIATVMSWLAIPLMTVLVTVALAALVAVIVGACFAAACALDCSFGLQ
jgi:hypothetical protein